MPEYKTQTIKAYNTVARTVIGEFDGYFEKWAHREAAHFLTLLKPGSLILDLGCGGGPASQYFVQHGYPVLSGDLSEEMIRECLRRGLPYPVRLDLEALPFRPQSFDAIWAHTSIIHIPKNRVAPALEAVLKILKPGGILFIAFREGKGEGYVNRIGEDIWFSRFHGNEFEHYIPEGFELLHQTRIQPGSLTFVNYYLKKRTVPI